MDRFSSRLFARVCLVLIALTYSVSSSSAQSSQGSWQTLPYTMPINPIHVALLYNGKVLIVSGSGNDPTNTNYRAALWDPQTGSITTQPVGWDMFCNAMIVLPDGRPFVISGTLQYDPFHGELRTSTYDPATDLFTDQQTLAHGRWYPTATVLGDGRTMVFSGLDETGATNTTVELYTIGSGWSAPYPAGWKPPLYPRMHLLRDGSVFYSGPGLTSAIFNPSTHTWTTGVATTNYSGTRTYGSSVLLPLLPANNYAPRVLILGGGNPSTATTELIDLSASTPKWVYGPNMSQPRVEMDATILPNGKILASGGSLNDEDATTASLNADLYDPVSNTVSPAGKEAYPRLYHSVTLLLPDGTVWAAGSNPKRGTYEPHMEIYSPAYLFNADGTAATRPTITSTSTSVIGYNLSFQVQTPDAANISSVVLMRNGAVTHAFDMDQRYVCLNFTAGAGVLNVTTPPNGNIAPPGYYMLFILNSSGVPSVATMVQLSLSAKDTPPSGTITSPASNVTIMAGQSVNYSGTGTDPDGTISAYSWSFAGGNPSSSNLASPGNVTYSTPGTYTTTFTVIDNAGLTDPNPPTRTITVQGPPGFSLSPTALSFTSQPINTASASQRLVLTNSGAGPLTISSIAISGTNPGDFSQTNTCPLSPNTLGSHASCNIDVIFKPSTSGSRSAAVVITDDAAGSPQNVSLTGVGVVLSPIVSLSTANITFGNQLVGTSSSAQRITLSNVGNAQLNFVSSGINVAGASSDFSQTNTCGSHVAAGANCVIAVTFNPATVGLSSATLKISDDASDSPQSVSLAGTGISPDVALSTTSLAFPAQLVTTSSGAQNISLSNSGSAALNIANIVLAGPNSSDFSQSSTCGTTLVASASCSIKVIFRPGAMGTRSASLVITDNANGSPHTVQLTGTGADFSIDAASGGPTSASATAGQVVTYNLQVTPLDGFNGSTALSCGNTSPQLTCAVSPGSVTPNGSSPSPFSARVTIAAASVSMPQLPQSLPISRPPLNLPRVGFPLLAVLLMLIFRTRLMSAWARRPVGFACALLFAAILSIAASISGCAGSTSVAVHNNSRVTGTYTLTITGTSNGVSHVQNLTLTVN